MSGGKNDNDNPVRVRGVERQHPAIRQLARACIELARLRLGRKEQRDGPSKDAAGPVDTEVPRG